jgi:hypothetical protein
MLAILEEPAAKGIPGIQDLAAYVGFAGDQIPHMMKHFGVANVWMDLRPALKNSTAQEVRVRVAPAAVPQGKNAPIEAARSVAEDLRRELNRGVGGFTVQECLGRAGLRFVEVTSGETVERI